MIKFALKIPKYIMTNQTDVPTSPDSHPAGRIRNMATTSLPWVATACSLVAISHAINLQTLAADAAGGNADAIKSARWIWAAVPAACAAGLATAMASGLAHRIITVVATVLATGLLGLAGPLFLAPLLLIPVALAGAHAYFSIRDKASWRPSIFATSLLTLLLALAAFKRQEMFFVMVNTKPDPDFFGYLTLTQTATGYSTQYREPLYVWLLQLMVLLGGEANELMLRLFGVASGIAATAALFHLCRRHLNLTTAVIATYFYATQKYMVYTSTRGLREDAIICASLLLVSAGWSLVSQPATALRLTGIGVLGAINSILRISSLSFAIGLIALTGLYRMIRDIKTWRQRAMWLLPIVITIAFTVPFLMNLKTLYGDPMFVVNRNAKFYANQELASIHPDFPTREEIATNAYAGPRITPREYVFKYHDMSEIISRTWQGFVKTFFGLAVTIGHNQTPGSSLLKLILLLHIIGIALLLFPQRLYLVGAMILFHAPTFFLTSFNYFDPRLLTFAMAFSYITVASAIGIGTTYIWRYVGPASTRPLQHSVRHNTTREARQRRRNKTRKT